MDNGQKSLNSLFDGRKIFKIPEYQRSYAWGEKQLNDFIDDFKNQKLDKEYFFGTILFQEAGKHGAYDVIEVVDGQQRITTLIIFINSLLSKITECDESTMELYRETYIKYKSAYKLEILSDDNEFFITYILENNDLPSELISTPSQKKLYEAKLFFDKILASDFTQNQLLELLNKVEKTKVLTYSVQDKSEATLIFETTNDRGKELTNLEKTKSFLMYKTYIAADEPEIMLASIQSRFSDIYKAYSDIDDKVDENSILQYNFIAYEEWKITQQRKEYQIYMEMMKNRINSMIKDSKRAETLKYIDRYSMTLRESYIVMKNMLTSQIPEFVDVQLLGHMATFYPLLIKSYRFDKTAEKKEFKKVCRLCEIFSFRVYSILRGMANKGQTTLFTIAKEFKGDFCDLYNRLKTEINYFGAEYQFLEYIGDADFFTFYSSPVKNYFFWKYENYLRSSEQPIAAPIPYQTYIIQDKRFKFSIEHILPQNPNAGTLKVITDALKHDSIDEKFEETYLHCIGNLTIDPMSANSSKGNSNIEAKNSKYFRKAPFKTQNALESYMIDGKWTHKSIENRKKDILKFAKVWWCNLEGI